jgi:hypothetical protein
VEKNPRFEGKDATLTFTAAGLKKFFDQTYDMGYKQGKEDGMSLSRPSPSTPDLFSQIFGGK